MNWDCRLDMKLYARKTTWRRLLQMLMLCCKCDYLHKFKTLSLKYAPTNYILCSTGIQNIIAEQTNQEQQIESVLFICETQLYKYASTLVNDTHLKVLTNNTTRIRYWRSARNNWVSVDSNHHDEKCWEIWDNSKCSWQHNGKQCINCIDETDPEYEKWERTKV